MTEKSYVQRVADLLSHVGNSDSVRGEPVPKDEYHLARLVTAHYGGNYLGGRLSDLSENKKPFRSAEETKTILLEGLGRVDQAKLPTERAQEFQIIVEEARTGEWDQVDFVKTLRDHCKRFSKGFPLFDKPEEDK